ncbi:hypothetical protein FF38_02310 [Lucilia cuprina]|uniref:Major facilitator superfamily (MFS) profile domain-containing protein n=1 Tax=Lucilia cuprina TaxID=7375 RepID=A0A0L0C6H5_LUCCU|nr:organic cation/carnitine transporter 7 [Lucilia cuprina]KAI8125492.1 Synaptic vesicle glycoprotein 2B [Lucilia cuprina]KNC27034.1 hypothetical protein FF38_02310 [Lucilia cuprina]
MVGIITNTAENDKGDHKARSLEDDKTPADFEKAISTAGFGRFNIFLLLVACPAAMASVVETAVISYILPSAECDLNLNLLDKGILNAITYCGMIISAIGWGYLSDKKGRKKLLVFGYLMDVICVLCGAMSQNVTQLMISKFFGGLVMCGPFAVLMSYLTEFHGTEHRPRIMMLIGIMFSMASILLPVLALLILPNEWNFRVFSMNFHSWQVYFAICCLPSLLSGILLTLFPESPRFLMSQGRNAEALKVFQKIFAINKGQPAENYPIKHLVNENPNHKDSDPADNISIATIEAAITTAKTDKDQKSNTINNIQYTKLKVPTGFKPLFFKPYLGMCIIVNVLNFFILLGQNTIRLWLPQLFASLHEYEQISSEATSMCSILEYSVNKTQMVQTVQNPVESCVVVITPATYTNNIIVAVTGFVAYLVAGSLINALGNKRIQVFGLLIAGTSGIALFWSSSALTTLIISSLYVCMGSISSTSAIGTSVNLFPTSLRTMIVSLSMMFGRMGSITGNVLFPVFMSFGCIPPFVMVGAVMYIGAILSALLPSTKKIELK